HTYAKRAAELDRILQGLSPAELTRGDRAGQGNGSSAELRNAPIPALAAPQRAEVNEAAESAPSRTLDIVMLGLSITSSWGNGHATTYRALVRGLTQRGHRVLFLERDVPWYA